MADPRISAAVRAVRLAADLRKAAPAAVIATAIAGVEMNGAARSQVNAFPIATSRGLRSGGVSLAAVPAT